MVALQTSVRRQLRNVASSARRTAFLIVVFSAFALANGVARAQTGFSTAVLPGEVSTPLTFQRIRAAGATYVKLSLFWSAVAPSVRGAEFRPEDPADPSYDWQGMDQAIKLAVANGLEPFMTMTQAPPWAERSAPFPDWPGSGNPDPVELGRFARAAAQRYSGSFGGLPRVRYWGVWNEPNISIFLFPQFVGTTPVSPAWYRQAVNSVADAVHGVHPDNVLIAGDTAPFRDSTSGVMAVDTDWGPLSFMREFLCLSRSLTPICNEPVHFDVWSHHAYGSGGPEHHAVLPDDVSLPDLPKMQRALDAASVAGHIVTGQKVGLWVTEFSWDSNPPDPRGVPVELESRWASEAVYRAWLNGVSVFTWFTLRDEPIESNPYQSGLYFRGDTQASDRPKPALQAFRFPVVAFPVSGGVSAWGRSPGGRPARVVVEQASGTGWKRLGLLRTDQYGIFQRRYTTSGSGSVRARLLPMGAIRRRSMGETSLPFSLTPVPDQCFVPFGLPYPLEPGC